MVERLFKSIYGLFMIIICTIVILLTVTIVIPLGYYVITGKHYIDMLDNLTEYTQEIFD